MSTTSLKMIAVKPCERSQLTETAYMVNNEKVLLARAFEGITDHVGGAGTKTFFWQEQSTERRDVRDHKLCVLPKQPKTLPTFVANNLKE